MKNIIAILLIVIVGCTADVDPLEDQLNAESVNNKSLQTLTEINFNDINEDSPLEDQLRLSALSVITDGINYRPLKNLKSDTKITRPEIAYQQLLKLKPELSDTIKCWGEYKGYYIFSLDLDENCSFLSIYYIQSGKDEFWYFYPQT